MEWREVRLADVCEITASPSSDSFAGLSGELEDGTPVLLPPDITTAGGIEDRHVRRLPGVPKSLERFRLAAGDVVVVRQGTLGKLALVTERQNQWLYGSACIRLRPDPGLIDPAFLAHYLAHPPVMGWLQARANPGTVTTVNATTLAQIPVAVPELGRQRLVCQALGEIDNQIAAQRQLARRLEVMRPALFADFLGGHELFDHDRYSAVPGEHQRPSKERRARRLS
jgi:type I restriction enzyme, S subunit